MNKLAVLGVTLSAAMLPLCAGAVGTSPVPLRVTNCSVDYVDQGVGGIHQYYTNGVTVSVRNLSDKPIASFSGGGMYNKQTITDTITHAIAPNAVFTFSKHYKAFAYNGSMAACFVSKVTFADGTTWEAPPMAPM